MGPVFSGLFLDQTSANPAANQKLGWAELTNERPGQGPDVRLWTCVRF